jgi:hypothetical protein
LVPGKLGLEKLRKWTPDYVLKKMTFADRSGRYLFDGVLVNIYFMADDDVKLMSASYVYT